MKPPKKIICLSCHHQVEMPSNNLPMCIPCQERLHRSRPRHEVVELALKMRLMMAQERIADFLDTFKGWYERDCQGDDDDPFNLFRGRN